MARFTHVLDSRGDEFAKQRRGVELGDHDGRDGGRIASHVERGIGDFFGYALPAARGAFSGHDR
jgi:hypothetical protein